MIAELAKAFIWVFAVVWAVNFFSSAFDDIADFARKYGVKRAVRNGVAMIVFAGACYVVAMLWNYRSVHR
jgi:hypothetical protein